MQGYQFETVLWILKQRTVWEKKKILLFVFCMISSFFLNVYVSIGDIQSNNLPSILISISKLTAVHNHIDDSIYKRENDSN